MTVEFGFEIVTAQDIPELRTHARLFRHLKSGAQLLSLENEDENKVFGISFRTPPDDSTGVAHIMEHAVLCGSRRYPLKEPFIELVKGSLRTFLNAITFPDRTCYPVASQNLQDFYNLIDVYMDAVLYPLIPESTLQQEGWHFELENLDDPLIYKGVVFNEMKGAYSSPDRVLYDYSQRLLFPDNTYGVASGGDPIVIPNLTYHQFTAFHQKYYHPSNAYIFFYGDDNPRERLRLLDEYLTEFDVRQTDSEIFPQGFFDRPRRVILPYDAGDSEEAARGRLTVNWLLPVKGDLPGPETLLALQILNYILIGSPASPLRKALIDSELGEDLAGVGMEEELLQPYFSIGLKGVSLNDAEQTGGGLGGDLGDCPGADRVERLILDTLGTLAQGGIDPEMVAAAVNTIEFRLRENNTGSFPRGLSLMFRALSTWLYGGDPIQPLAFEAPLAAIKRRLSSEHYFEALIQRYFLDNPHRVTAILQPDPGLRHRLEAAERERLEQARLDMGIQELQGLIENTRQLKLRQETPDPPELLELIPSLALDDLDRHNKLIPSDALDLGGCRVFYHNLFTNGILYLDLGFNLHLLPQALLPYSPLFGRALLEMGTQSQDFVRLSQRIDRATGGIWPSIYTSVVQRQGTGVKTAGKESPAGEEPSNSIWLFLRGKSTTQQARDLLSILNDVLITARLDDQERFLQIAQEEKAELEAVLVSAGHRMVNLRLRAPFNEADWANEQMNGVSQLFFLRDLIREVEENWPSVLARLEEIRLTLLNQRAMLCNITLDSESWGRFRPVLSDFFESIPSEASSLAPWMVPQTYNFQGLTIPAQVNYVGKGVDLYDLGYRLDGSLFVINNYLRTTWLWEKVRVQGGAYGGLCQFDHSSGIFTLLSYRDPNLLETLEVYDQTGRFLQKLDSFRLTQTELTRSIIGAIGDMDTYLLPDAKGYRSLERYLSGDTEENRQIRREQILSTTLADFNAFGDVLEHLHHKGNVVVMGSHESIAAADAARPGWLDVQKVL